MVDPPPPAASQVGQPGAGGGKQVWHLLTGGRGDGRRAVGPAGHLVNPGYQRVVY